jgi:hypothetical protein
LHAESGVVSDAGADAALVQPPRVPSTVYATLVASGTELSTKLVVEPPETLPT